MSVLFKKGTKEDLDVELKCNACGITEVYKEYVCFDRDIKDKEDLLNYLSSFEYDCDCKRGTQTIIDVMLPLTNLVCARCGKKLEYRDYDFYVCEDTECDLWHDNSGGTTGIY